MIKIERWIETDDRIKDTKANRSIAKMLER